MGGTLITRHPPAELREVESKESSGEAEEIVGDKARTLEGGVGARGSEGKREQRREVRKSLRPIRKPIVSAINNV